MSKIAICMIVYLSSCLINFVAFLILRKSIERDLKMNPHLGAFESQLYLAFIPVVNTIVIVGVIVLEVWIVLLKIRLVLMITYQLVKAFLRNRIFGKPHNEGIDNKKA